MQINPEDMPLSHCLECGHVGSDHKHVSDHYGWECSAYVEKGENCGLCGCGDFVPDTNDADDYIDIDDDPGPQFGDGPYH